MNKRAKKPATQATPRGERRARIFAAADTLFCARGYASVSVRDVAQAAEVNKALVFYYFESKDQLFAEVLGAYYAAHHEFLGQTAAASQGPLRERVLALVGAYFEWMADHAQYARLIQQEVARESDHLPLIRSHLAELHAPIEALLGDLLPTEGPLSPKHFFVSISGMTTTYFTHAPALGALWGVAPESPAARAERREHLTWVVDAILTKLGVPG